MKKVLFSLLALAMVAGVTSCKKERDCVCKGGSVGDHTYSMEKAKKKDAKKACDDAAAVYKLAGAHDSCELK